MAFKKRNILMIVNNTLLYIVLFLPFSLLAQTSQLEDTIRINEVVISSKKLPSSPSVYKETSVDSAVIHDYSTSSLAELLSGTTDIFIKSYGMGATATPSLRGTGASHTIIEWNGININSPMLGQSDFALLPVGLMDEVRIRYGGASMAGNYGGIGGSINLETSPEWKKQSSFTMNAGAGSFNRYTGMVKVNAGTDSFQSVTKAYFMSAENDFRFLNTKIAAEPMWQRRLNNQTAHQGLMQEVYYKLDQSSLSARVWYQNSDRNLPSTMISESNTGERQVDESLKTMLNYTGDAGHGILNLTGAWIYNRLDYFNRLASIDSRNKADVLTFKAIFILPAGQFSELKFIADEVNDFVRSNNYAGTISRNTISAALSFERIKGRLGSSLLIREILDKSNLLVPDFTAGIRLKIAENLDYYLKTSFSKNSRIPSMNDMYWNPGGNTDLKNEYAYMYDISWEMNQKISLPLDIKYEVTFFISNIKDMIQWHPGDYTYWTSDNINSVRAAGLESAFNLNYVQPGFNGSFRASYSYNRSYSNGSYVSEDNTKGKQLPYIPLNKLNATVRFGKGIVYGLFTSNFTGRRYTTTDNSEFLDAYMVNSISSGVKFRLKGSTIDTNFTVDNVFNINYESIAYYPLPGRSYFLKVLIQIIK